MNPSIALRKQLQKIKVNSEQRKAADKVAKAASGSLFKREYYPTYISRQAKWRVNIIRKTQYLDKTEKGIILPKAKKLAVRLAYINLFDRRILYFLQVAQNIVMLVFSLGVGIVSSDTILANPWNAWGTNPFYRIPLDGLLIGTFSPYLYLALMRLADRKSRNRPHLKLPPIDFLLSFVGLTILISFSSKLTLNVYTFALYTFFVSIGGRWLLVYLFNIMDELLFFVFDTFVHNNQPESIVMNNIVKILDAIELHPEWLSDLEFKKATMTWLDYVADAISKDTPKLLRTSDREFNNSIKTNYQKIANSIKDKKLWILMPRDDTAKCLANFLASFLFHFMKGDWDLLERSDAPELTLYEKWTKRYLPILRPMIFIGVPIIVYWALKTYELLSEPWAGTVVSYSILWVIINIIWLIDPLAKEKTGSIKDVTGLF